MVDDDVGNVDFCNGSDGVIVWILDVCKRCCGPEKPSALSNRHESRQPSRGNEALISYNF